MKDTYDIYIMKEIIFNCNQIFNFEFSYLFK